MQLVFGPFQAVVGVVVVGLGEGVFLWTASKVKSLAHASHFPRFILLISFSDTLLVVIAM